MEAPQPGNDDRRVAVARREVAGQLMTDTGNLAHPGQTGERTGESHDQQNSALRRHTGIERGPRILTHDPDLVTPARAPQHDPEDERGDEPEEETEMNAGRAPMREPTRRGQ